VKVIKDIQSTVFWDVMPCRMVEVHHSRRLSKAASRVLLAACFLHDLLIKPEDGGSTFLQNGGLLLDYMALHPRR
jgi:hypothetical protein